MTRKDSASRVIEASPAIVHAALVDPEALVQWLPPEGMTGRFEWFEPRPGGGYRLVLTYAETSGGHGKTAPDSDVVEARFVEVVADDVPDGISAEDHAVGLASSLANLASYVGR